MSKAGFGSAFLVVAVALTVLCFGPSLTLAQEPASPTIQIKPCFECPTGTTNADGSFTCPDADSDGSPDWIACGTPSINLCSKGRTAVAILDYADFGITHSGTTITFEGATPVRCSASDVDHDVVAGGEPDDLVCLFRTQDLTGLQAKADRNRNLVQARMTLIIGEIELLSHDDVVIFRRGSCTP